MLVLFANETRLVAISIELGSSILYRCGDFVIYGLIYIRVISEFKTLGGVFKMLLVVAVQGTFISPAALIPLFLIVEVFLCVNERSMVS